MSSMNDAACLPLYVAAVDAVTSMTHFLSPRLLSLKRHCYGLGPMIAGTELGFALSERVRRGI